MPSHARAYALCSREWYGNGNFQPKYWARGFAKGLAMRTVESMESQRVLFYRDVAHVFGSTVYNLAYLCIHQNFLKIVVHVIINDQ